MIKTGLENGCFTPGCLTVQTAIRLSLLRRLIPHKQVRKLRVTLYACNASVSVKEERTMRCNCVCAINQERVGCVYVDLSSWTKSPVVSYLYAYVMEALLKVLKKGAPQNVCVYVHARSSVGMGVCVSSSLSSRQLLVCVCMHMYANTTKRLRLHFPLF